MAVPTAASLCNFDYTVTFYDRAGRALDATGGITDLGWGRRLDDISRSDITYCLSNDNCCTGLGALEPYAHSMAIRRNNILVWYGWILDVDYGRENVQVNCFDALGWTRRRRIRTDLDFINQDVAVIAEAIWHDAMDISPIAAEIMTIPTGVFESRSVRREEYRFAWNVLTEMLGTGLDMTVFGQKILNGIIYSVKPIELTLADVQGDIRFLKDGTQYGNSIIVDANESVVAQYPPTIPNGTDNFPLVEQIIKDSQIQDTQSALNAAQSRYEYAGRRPPRIVQTQDGLTLNPNVDVTINDLVAGVKVILDTTGLCIATKQEFRLGTLDVRVTEGEETINISLQPVGAQNSLADAEDASF